MNEQLGILASIEPYMGRYFSSQHVRTKILKQTETEIKEIDAQIDKEIDEGILPDPAAAIDPMTGMPMAGGMDLGAPVTEPDINKQGDATQIKMPKGGEI